MHSPAALSRPDAAPTALADVIPLVRPDASCERDSELASSSPSEKDQLASSAGASFVDAILPVEVADDEPLGGWGRAQVHDAFEHYPVGVAAAAIHAAAAKTRQRKPVRSARRLLVSMIVEDKWHVHAERISRQRIAASGERRQLGLAVDRGSFVERIFFDDVDARERRYQELVAELGKHMVEVIG
jgi:hypothetical protein